MSKPNKNRVEELDVGDLERNFVFPVKEQNLRGQIHVKRHSYISKLELEIKHKIENRIKYNVEVKKLYREKSGERGSELKIKGERNE